jgi:hypothetical protein
MLLTYIITCPKEFPLQAVSMTGNYYVESTAENMWPQMKCDWKILSE